MAEDLPEQFDLVVLGTGFVESCVAAAASRIGKSVLHVDPNEYYGDVWSSFSLEALNALLERGDCAGVRNGRFTWHVRPTTPVPMENETDANKETWTQESMLTKSRRFSLDLCPRVLYADGDLVQLLIKSNICRYAEFRALDHVCMLFHEELVSVPCSRSDVFNSKTLSIIEKRLLMKFLMSCNDYGEDKITEDTLAFRGKTFMEYLQAQRVTDKISCCVIKAIAMCNADTSFEEGMQRTQRFLRSLGRYGHTPFLFPMYGCGELPQCFCRLCAVYGGIYCLNRTVKNVTVSPDSNELVFTSGEKTLRATHMVCAPAHLPSELASQYGELRPQISRGLFIGTTPLGNEELNKGGGGVNLLRLVANDGQREAILIQLSHYSGACPEGLYIFHMTTPAVSEDPSADLSIFTAQVFKENAPEILYSAFFTITERSRSSTAVNSSMPIFCTNAPTYELDYDAAIANARDLFGRLYTNEAFLPRAPDPEEIVIDGEDPSALNEHSLPEDLRAQLLDMQQATQQMDIGE